MAPEQIDIQIDGGDFTIVDGQQRFAAMVEAGQPIPVRCVGVDDERGEDFFIFDPVAKSFMLDVEKYRFFVIVGQLQIGDQKVHVHEASHASDLPAGDAGREEVADRVALRIARQYGDRPASWLKLTVTEQRPTTVFVHFGPSVL